MGGFSKLSMKNKRRMKGEEKLRISKKGLFPC